MPRSIIDETGKKYGLLTVLKRYGYYNRMVTWLCKCNCGKEIVVVGASLRNGNTKSCGCLKSVRSCEAHFKHGGASRKGE